MSVDRYGDYLVIHLYSEAADPFLDALCDGLEGVWAPRAIYVQRRFRPIDDAPRR